MKLATETDDNDDGIGDIIKTNETVERILNQYKTIVGSENLLFVEIEDDKMLTSESNDSLRQSKKSIVNNNSISPNKYDPLKELQDLFSTPLSTTTSATSDLPPVYASFNNSNNEFGSFTDETTQSVNLGGMPQSNSNPAISSTTKTNFDDLLSNLNKMSIGAANLPIKPLQPLTPNSNSNTLFLSSFYFKKLLIPVLF